MGKNIYYTSKGKNFGKKISPIWGNHYYMKRSKAKIDKIIKEWKDASPSEVWENVLVNFTFGFLGATLVVFIATRTDLAVLVGYITYYTFMGKIVNRPKYVTDLGKLIVFPYSSAFGAFIGYKISYIILEWIKGVGI